MTELEVESGLKIDFRRKGTIYFDSCGGSAYVDGITQTPFALDDQGYLTIPSAPGLGVALDRDKLARVTRDPAPLFAAR